MNVRLATKHRVADLHGALLDAAVAKAEGWAHADGWWQSPNFTHTTGQTCRSDLLPLWSTLWERGGPIIEREWITLAAVPAGKRAPLEWMAVLNYVADGPEKARAFDARPLVAAMRAYVASKFGDEIELP